MFALEIAFSDGVSQPETILVRRPQALIGSTDYAHVVIDDLKSLPYQIRLIRDLGRRFRTKPVSTGSEPAQIPAGVEGVYDGSVSLNLGAVRLFITTLDVDLQLRDNEPPDRAGVRILRQAAASQSPAFPAVVVRGGLPMIISFSPEQPVFVGRSKQCGVRLDSADISARHARIGFEARQFWVEDLGSTNGTFVHEQQISGRVNVPPGTPIVVGREITLIGVTSEEEVIGATRGTAEARRAPAPENRYPVLVSVSEMVRPARVVIMPGMTLTIGRDPASDIWVGAPHVSRKHCSVSMDDDGHITITDSSTNGTGYEGGVLRNGAALALEGRPRVLDFGGGVTVATCFREEEETLFNSTHGASHAFTVSQTPATSAGGSRLPALVRNAGGSDLRTLANNVIQRPGAVAYEIARIFRTAGTVGRLMFVLVSAALIVVIGVIANLLLPLWAR